MTFRPPTRRQIILVFLIGAPIIWPFPYAIVAASGHPSALVAHGTLTALLFMDIFWWVFGLFYWWGWFLTWIPTALAAIASQAALRVICDRYRARSGGRLVLVGICCLVCALIYAALLGTIALIISPGEELGSIGLMALAAGFTGALLGVVVGAWPTLTPSSEAKRVNADGV